MESFAISLVCDTCHREVSLREPVTTCPYCGGLLEVQYDYAAMKRHMKQVASVPEAALDMAIP